MNLPDHQDGNGHAIRIGDRWIGRDHPTYVIAEIGINHNGDPANARRLIDIAAEAKADAVKFQKRHLPSLYREDVLKQTEHYEQNFQYMIPILKKTELSEEDLAGLKDYAEDRNLEFLCTPFDPISADFLEGMGVNAFKIASADLNNEELIEHVASKGRPMLVSTGMSYWEEIESTVAILRHSKIPFALLHCRSVYPVWPREVNLRMINQLNLFGVPVGYSGHDIGITIPLVAASMGASIIEKHLTLDKNMEGPDHKVSLEGFELKRMIRDIRVADQAMGKRKRFLLRGEILNRELFGKSLVAACDIRTGERVDRHMIRVQGPGKGLPPSKIRELLGKTVKRDIPSGSFFEDEDLHGRVAHHFENTFRCRWGLICRFSDLEDMLAYHPKVIEFHLAEQDLSQAPELRHSYSQELIVHAPEYMGEHLLDLCSTDDDIRYRSVESVRETIELTRSLAVRFQGRPKVIVHPGAMSLNRKLDKEALHGALLRSLEQIDRNCVDLLLENLPPYPWYFGGQWKGNYFMGAEEIRSFCEETDTDICFDLSHAALYCNAKEKDLARFLQILMPYIRHVHFADGYGLDGEGVPFGQGDIPLDRVLPLFQDYDGTWVPEIWRGHLQKGRGFLEALRFLRRYGL